MTTGVYRRRRTATYLNRYPVSLRFGAGVVLADSYYHDFEQDAPSEEYAATYTSQAYFGTTARSTDQANSGSSSIKINEAWGQLQVYNDTDIDKFGPTTEQGNVECYHYIPSAAFASGLMLFQIDGKSNDGGLDTNDGFQVLFSTSGGASTKVYAVTCVNDVSGIIVNTSKSSESYPVLLDQWVKVRLEWNINSTGHTAWLYQNDVMVWSTSTAIPAFICNAWHHFSIGNDRSGVPPAAYYIDDFSASSVVSGDPEGSLIHGKLLNGLLTRGVLVG